jgi:outer membrane protein OmpA-like peptidoglycan-associated protein
LLFETDTAWGASKKGPASKVQSGWAVRLQGPMSTPINRFFACLTGQRCNPKKVFFGARAHKKWSAIKQKIGRHKRLQVRFLAKVADYEGKNARPETRRKIRRQWDKRWGRAVQKLARAGFVKKKLAKLGRGRGWVKANATTVVALVQVRYKMLGHTRTDLAMMVLIKKRAGWRLAFWDDQPKDIVRFLWRRAGRSVRDLEQLFDKDARKQSGSSKKQELKQPSSFKNRKLKHPGSFKKQKRNRSNSVRKHKLKQPSGFKKKVRIKPPAGIKIGFFFPRTSTHMKPFSKPQVRVIARALKKHPSIRRAAVNGYADDYRSKKRNRRLARRRARLVKRLLVKAGVKASRLKVRSHGFPPGVTRGGKKYSHLRNRKVNITVLQRR